MAVTTLRDRQARRRALRHELYPECRIDEFTRADSSIEFYLRVNALVDPDDIVVDLGAGRGAWFYDHTSHTRRSLRMLQGKAAKVIGLDVDDAVLTNPSLDDAQLVEPGGPLPLSDRSVGLVVSDATFEHIDDPAQLAAELSRVLRPGGWVCARTPNRNSYVGVMARAVPNTAHLRFLKRLQPDRKDVDVFPVRYRLNRPRDLRRWFPPEQWEHTVYTTVGEPAYAGSSRLMWRAFRTALRLQPQAWQPSLLIFLRKR